MLLVSYFQPYSWEFRYDGAGNNDFFHVLDTSWLRYIAKRRAEHVGGSFSESYWNLENKYHRNKWKVFIFDGKVIDYLFFWTTAVFPNGVNTLFMNKLPLNVLKQVVFENPLNPPVKSQLIKAWKPNSAILFLFPNALDAHPRSISRLVAWNTVLLHIYE